MECIRVANGVVQARLRRRQVYLQGNVPRRNIVKPSKYAGRKVLSYEKCDYYRQGGDLVAGYSSYEQWLDEKKAVAMNTLATTDLAKMPEYSEAELKEIYAAQDREEIRGANPRYWEDVKVGDELTPVVRGPVNDAELTSLACSRSCSFYIREINPASCGKNASVPRLERR